jgi:nitrogen fixation protein FixH
MHTQQPSIALPAWKSPWVIAWVSAILVVLGVNIFMAYLAIHTSPGLVVNDYYARGQDYEKHMVSRLARDPAWSMNIGLPKVIYAGGQTALQFTILDKAGVPVEPQSVTLYAYRPSDARQDFSVPMEMKVKGLYTAKAQFRLKGVWDLLVSVQMNGEEHNSGQRIHVTAPY